MFSERLKALRTERGLTQAKLSKELGTKIPNYSTYENGREPPFSILCAIAKYFGVTTDYLLGLTDARKPENASVMDKYGLSETALNTLADMYSRQKKNSITLTVNALLEEKDTLESLAQYLYYSTDFFNAGDESQGKAIPYQLRYRYYDSGDNGNSQGGKPVDPYVIMDAVGNAMCKRISLLKVQERLTALLEHEKEMERYTTYWDSIE